MTGSRAVAAEPNHSALPVRARVLLEELKDRSVWFVRLRWWIATCLAVGVAAAKMAGVHVAVGPLLLVAIGILAYNLVFRLWLSHFAADPAWQREDLLRRFTTWQVGCDDLAMLFLLQFTGGIGSPFIFFFIFHIIFASILLKHRTAFAFVGLVSVGVGLLTLAESAGWLAYRPIGYQGEVITLFDQPLPLFVRWIIFSASLFFSTLVTTDIMEMVRRRIHELANLTAEVEQLSETRERFLARVTHNLRSPLAAIVSIVNVVRDGYVGDLSARQSEYLRRIDRRARNMMDLVNELLLLSEQQSGKRKLRVSPLDWSELALRLRHSFQHEAEDRAIDLEIAVPPDLPALPGEQDLMETMLENLLSNALKYTPGGGRVNVAFTADGAGGVRLTVADTGIGIPPDDRKQLFTEFFRADNARHVEAIGTGLGLAVVREIVEGHGGRISVESEAGQGSRFTVHLPDTRPPSERSR